MTINYNEHGRKVQFSTCGSRQNYSLFSFIIPDVLELRILTLQIFFLKKNKLYLQFFPTTIEISLLVVYRERKKKKLQTSQQSTLKGPNINKWLGKSFPSTSSHPRNTKPSHRMRRLILISSPKTKYSLIQDTPHPFHASKRKCSYSSAFVEQRKSNVRCLFPENQDGVVGAVLYSFEDSNSISHIPFPLFPQISSRI